MRETQGLQITDELDSFKVWFLHRTVVLEVRLCLFFCSRASLSLCIRHRGQVARSQNIVSGLPSACTGWGGVTRGDSP